LNVFYLEISYDILSIMKENIEIRKLKSNEEPPMELLLLADPSVVLVKKYLENGSCFVCLKDGQIVGEYLIMPKSEIMIELMNVAVMEKYQGLGLGKMLVLHSIMQARNLGFKTIEVGTADIGVMQIALYKKCGFKDKEIWEDFFIKNYPEPIYDEGAMCKDMVRLNIEL